MNCINLQYLVIGLACDYAQYIHGNGVNVDETRMVHDPAEQLDSQGNTYSEQVQRKML